MTKTLWAYWCALGGSWCLLSCRIHVCCWVCVVRKLIVGRCALCSGCVLCIFVVNGDWFVQYRLIYRYYMLISIYHFFPVLLYFGVLWVVWGVVLCLWFWMLSACYCVCTNLWFYSQVVCGMWKLFVIFFVSCS